MAIGLLGLAGLAVFHFVYTGILLPSLRYRLRLRLYLIRDRLRNIQIADDKKISPEVFEVLQTSINNSIHLLPRINAMLVWDVERRIESQPELKREIADRRAIINLSPDSRVKEIDREVTEVVQKALNYNMFPWFVYLVPIAIIVWRLLV